MKRAEKKVFVFIRKRMSFRGIKLENEKGARVKFAEAIGIEIQSLYYTLLLKKLFQDRKKALSENRLETVKRIADREWETIKEVCDIDFKVIRQSSQLYNDELSYDIWVDNESE